MARGRDDSQEDSPTPSDFWEKSRNFMEKIISEQPKYVDVDSLPIQVVENDLPTVILIKKALIEVRISTNYL